MALVVEVERPDDGDVVALGGALGPQADVIGVLEVVGRGAGLLGAGIVAQGLFLELEGLVGDLGEGAVGLHRPAGDVPGAQQVVCLDGGDVFVEGLGQGLLSAGLAALAAGQHAHVGDGVAGVVDEQLALLVEVEGPDELLAVLLHADVILVDERIVPGGLDGGAGVVGEVVGGKDEGLLAGDGGKGLVGLDNPAGDNPGCGKVGGINRGALALNGVRALDVVGVGEGRAGGLGIQQLGGVGLHHGALVVAEVEELLLVGSGGHPGGKALTVGIAGFDKVCDVVDHVVGDAEVGLVKGTLIAVEGAEGVVEIGGVEGAELVLAGLLAVEVVEVDALAAGLGALLAVALGRIVEGQGPHILAEHADDARHVLHGVLLESSFDVAGQAHAVDVGGGHAAGLEPGPVELLGVQIGQVLEGVNAQIELHGVPAGLDGLGGGGVADGADVAAAAHHNGAGDEALLHQGRDEQVLHADGAGALAHDGDFGGIAAVVLDVVPDPVQGGHLVADGHIAGVAIAHGGGEGPETVVDGHGDDAVVGIGRAVGGGVSVAAGDVGAAVDVHQHRAVLGVVRRPDVQVQAVLAVVCRHGGDGLVGIELVDDAVLNAVEALVLAGAVAPDSGVIGAAPACNRNGILPARRGGVAHAPEFPVAAVLHAGDVAAGGLDGDLFIIGGHVGDLLHSGFFLPGGPGVLLLLGLLGLLGRGLLGACRQRQQQACSQQA